MCVLCKQRSMGNTNNIFNDMKYKYKVVRNRQRICNQVLIPCIEFILYILYINDYKKTCKFNVGVLLKRIYFDLIGKIILKENLDAKHEILSIRMCLKTPFKWWGFTVRHCSDPLKVETTFKNKLQNYKGWEKTIVETQNILTVNKPTPIISTSKYRKWRLQIKLHKKCKYKHVHIVFTLLSYKKNLYIVFK